MTDITCELIDFRSPAKQSENFRNPLVPLPKYDRKEDGDGQRECLQSGDNPFDAVTLEACNSNDPFEIVEAQARKQSAHSPVASLSQGDLPATSRDDDVVANIGQPQICSNSVPSPNLEKDNKEQLCKNKAFIHDSTVKQNNCISPDTVLKKRFSVIHLGADHEKLIFDESSIGIEDLVLDTTIFQSTPKKKLLKGTGSDIFVHESDETHSNPEVESEKKRKDIKAFVNSRIEKCIQKALNNSRQSINTTLRHKRSLSAVAVQPSFGNVPYLSYFNSSSCTKPVTSALHSQHSSPKFNRFLSSSSQDLRSIQDLHSQKTVPTQLNSSQTLLSEPKRRMHRRAHSASLDVLCMDRKYMNSPPRDIFKLDMQLHQTAASLDFSRAGLRHTHSSSLDLLSNMNTGVRCSSNAPAVNMLNVGMRRSAMSSSLDVLNTADTGSRFNSPSSPVNMNAGMRRSSSYLDVNVYNRGMGRSASMLDVAASLPLHSMRNLSRNAFSSNSIHQVSSSNIMSPKVERTDVFLKAKSQSCVSLEAKNLSGLFRHKAETFDCPEAADSSGEEDFLTRKDWEVKLVDSESDIDSASDTGLKCKEEQKMGNRKHQQRGSRLSVETGVGNKGQAVGGPGPMQRSRSVGGRLGPVPAPAEPLSREAVRGMCLRDRQKQGTKFSPPLVRAPPVALPQPGSGGAASTRLKPKAPASGPAGAKGPLKAVIPLREMMRNGLKKDSPKSSKRSPLNARCTNPIKQTRGNSSSKPCPIAESTPNGDRASTPKFQDSKMLSPIVRSCDRLGSVPEKVGVEPLVSPPLSLRMPSSILSTKPHSRSRSAEQPPAAHAASTPVRKGPQHVRPQKSFLPMKKSISKSPIQEGKKGAGSSQYVTTPLRPRAGNSPTPGPRSKAMPANVFRQLLWKKNGAALEKENLKPSTAY